MTQRRPIIAGNWKMNTTLSDAKTLATTLANTPLPDTVDTVLCPPFISLSACHEAVKNTAINTGGQCLHPNDSGAYTGDISGPMLKSVGASYVIIGHSERRDYHKEDNAYINAQLNAAYQADLTPILCIGESEAERENNATFTVLEKQLTEGLSGLKENIKQKDIIIAYEPIWAIGTGKVATPEMAQETHAFIRKTLVHLLGTETAETIRLQYGGSVKHSNAKDLLSQADIDGALVGGASLNADDFIAIINAA